MTILCYNNCPVDVHLKGIGKLQFHPGCKGYSPNTLLYGISVVGDTSMQVAGDFVSQIDINYVCCEELRAKVNLCRMPVDIAYKKTTAHLDDLRSVSTRVSDLLKKVDEQDWKNHHVIYRNTHSILLLVIVGVVSICLLFKLYNFTLWWKHICFRKQEASTTPTEVLPKAELENHERTVQ